MIVADSSHQQLLLHNPGAGSDSPVQIQIGRNATLTLYRVRDAAAPGPAYALDITLERDARLHLVTLDLTTGGRQDLNILLDGTGAQATLHGLFAASQGEMHNELRIVHRAPHCTSRAYYRGLAGAGGKAVFNGTVEVVPQAQKSDSELRIANLLLSPKAEINAKPELQIRADDVKCAHGATFGQLDEDALFYLRSRGIAREQARRLLTAAFAQAPLEQIADVALREKLSLRLQERLTEMLA
ncbi:MAG: SufD family Fe-S cluster assembly protein [Pseudomonadota bacterium]